MEPFIHLNIADETARISFFHPKGNSFPHQQLLELTDVFKKLGEDSSIKTILLESRGKDIFSAGASFDEMVSLKSKQAAFPFFEAFGFLLLAISKCPKVVVAKVEGKVVGGGLGIVAACDMAIASTEVVFRMSKMSMGVAPLVVAPAIENKIGRSNLLSVLMRPNDWFSAEDGRNFKLFDFVVESQNLQKKTDEILTAWNQYPTPSIEAIKNFWNRNNTDWMELIKQGASTSSELLFQPFSQDLIESFLKKLDNH